jgi:DNA-damage-inducible protein J
MPNVTVQSRVNPELKMQAEQVFSAMGLSVADGIRMFLQQTVNMGGLPFRPSSKQPNKETLAAIEEIEKGGGIRYSSVEDMFKDLDI